MIRALFLLLSIAAFMLAVAWFADRPGNVSIVWQGWRIDTSVPILVAAVALLAAAAGLHLPILAGADRRPWHLRPLAAGAPPAQRLCRADAGDGRGGRRRPATRRAGRPAAPTFCSTNRR